jgi:hypothetical protein
MSDAISSAQSGRAAAIARRLAMSEGKAALPPATERVRVGRHGAVLPAPSAAAPVPAAPAPVAAESPSPSPSSFAAGGALSGRHLAIERRRLLSAGKAALAAAPAGAAASPAAVRDAPPVCADTSCKEQARARRAALSLHGRGDAAAARPTRPPRVGTIEYAPKVTASATQAGQRVTGLRIGQGPQVTGDTRGTGQPVSGTQYIAADSGAAWRAGGPKVGHARTDGGLVVSGTLVRSKVRITGDEAGSGVTITGEADQRLDDDVTLRTASGAVPVQSQGAAAFAGQSGRSALRVGSRERSREVVLEATEKGLPITGAALGRSVRVTGDEGGACRQVTGSQYLAPARRQAACGFAGGGTAPAEQLGTSRADPVTAGKVTVAQSWGGQRITGFDVEHHPRVTGDAPGSCSALTGSQYQGRVTVDGYCATEAADAAAARRTHGSAGAAVTGDTPVHAPSVSGTARGAARDITGTPYYRAEAEAAGTGGSTVARLDDRFSVKSPQRAAQLRAVSSAVVSGHETSRITGSFAAGGEKITGNIEFLARSRTANPDRPPAHARISGEGRAAGNRITGDSWADQRNVTGTEGAFAADRNPSVRGPKAKPFAGAANFKTQAKHEEPKQLVTGMFGYFSKTGARVTLSGGAQS